MVWQLNIARALPALSIVMALALPAQDREGGKGGEPRPAGAEKAVPAPQAALKAAAALLDKVTGTTGPDRLARLEEAAKAYERVAGEFAGDKQTAARAWYEAGDIWRRHGSLAPAEKAFAQALAIDPARFGERAALQLGNMQRRLKRYDEAIVHYRQAAGFKPDSARAQEARLWIGRTLQEKGAQQEAAAAFREAADKADSAVEVVEACNYLAKSLLALGDGSGAQAAIDRAAQAVETAEGKEQERAKREFDDMSARRALQRERDQKPETKRDAADLERGAGEGRKTGASAAPKR
ncbi:MAG: tetratricopeptide repeat protein [Planctomycetes bacterium]|nr:tetratricopeptide repeat protein [Planctomycetota bacterium]